VKPSFVKVPLLVHEADAVELDRRAKARGKRDFATIMVAMLFFESEYALLSS
jgi:hypothetical protein